MTLEKFTLLTQVVIDSFEGGYYHPSMKLRMKPSDAAKIGNSGETMFGLDRKYGASLAKYPEWVQFWKLIDGAGAATKWKQYYRGGTLEVQLKQLASGIMYQWFSSLSKKYLSLESQEKIASDDRLIIHFSYASWNGEGWFKKFAVALNSAHGDKEFIYQQTIKARTESSSAVIRQQGANMLRLFQKLKL